MTEECIAAFDPGKSGALAIYFPSNRNHVATFDLPIIGKHLNGVALVDMLEQYAPTYAAIEGVGAMPGQGSSSGFNFGRNFGALLGIVQALRIPYALITPQKWKKAFGLSSDKSLSRQRATEFFPKCADQFKRVKDDGKAEAALLAVYAAEYILSHEKMAA